MLNYESMKQKLSFIIPNIVSLFQKLCGSLAHVN